MRDLAANILREQQRRQRSQPVIQQLDYAFHTVQRCNLCGSAEITAITASDRYGIPVRAGQCARCGLIFLIDRLSAEDYAHFYDHYYRPLVSAYLGRSVEAGTLPDEQQRYADRLIHALRGMIPAGGDLLDVGGSTGTVAAAFRAQFNFTATVLDPSQAELDVAARLGLKTIHGLLESWTPPAGLQFDVVLCCRTIDHFLDLAGSLDKLRSLIKPGGVLVIDIVDFDMVWAKKQVIEAAIKLDHCYYLASENAPALFRCVGLEPSYAEVFTNSERVTYLCRPGAPQPLPPQLADWAARRLRTIQAAHYALEHDAPDALTSRQRLRKQAYRLKKRVAGWAL